MHARFTLLIPLLIALPASAGTLSSVVVSHADLNLVSTKGQATLDRRIDSAIEKVCGYGANPTLAQRAAEKKCETAARADASMKMQVAIQRAATANALASASTPPKS